MVIADIVEPFQGGVRRGGAPVIFLVAAQIKKYDDHSHSSVSK
jgi:hypothetical protein